MPLAPVPVLVTGLDAGDAGELAVHLARGTGGLDRGHAAADVHERVGGKALLAGAGDVHVDGSVTDDDGLLTADAVAGAGGDFHCGRGHEADVVVGGDARLAGSVDGQGAVAAEHKLAFGEEGGLLVLVGGRQGVGSAVGEGVRALHDHERALVALVVDGRAFLVRQRKPVEEDFLFLGAVQLEIPVGGGARELVDHGFVAIVGDGHAGPVGGDGEVGGRAAHGGASAAERHLHGAGESGVGDVVVVLVGVDVRAGGIVDVDRCVGLVVGKDYVDGVLRAALHRQGGEDQEEGYCGFHDFFRF